MSIEFIVECMHTTVHVINCFVNIVRTSAHQAGAHTTKITESIRIYFLGFHLRILFFYSQCISGGANSSRIQGFGTTISSGQE